MFRAQTVKPSELITEFIQKTIVPLKTATEQQKNNYRRLVEVVNRFESQVPSADDDAVANAMSGESKTAQVLKEVVGQEQGPIEIANRKHLVMLLSFLSDLHVDQLPISYLTSGVRLSTFDTISTTPTHTTIIIGSRLKYLKTQLSTCRVVDLTLLTTNFDLRRAYFVHVWEAEKYQCEEASNRSNVLQVSHLISSVVFSTWLTLQSVRCGKHFTTCTWQMCPISWRRAKSSTCKAY